MSKNTLNSYNSGKKIQKIQKVENFKNGKNVNFDQLSKPSNIIVPPLSRLEDDKIQSDLLNFAKSGLLETEKNSKFEITESFINTDNGANFENKQAASLFEASIVKPDIIINPKDNFLTIQEISETLINAQSMLEKQAHLAVDPEKSKTSES